MKDYTEFEKGRRRLPSDVQRHKQLNRKTLKELQELAKSKGIEIANLSKRDLVNALSEDRGE